MQQCSSSEGNRFSASQKIPHILWNPTVHYRIHKCSPPVPILSQIDPVHNPTANFLKMHLNIILPSTPGCSKWSLSLKFSYQNPVYTSPLPHTCYMPRSSHSSRFYRPINIGYGVQNAMGILKDLRLEQIFTFYIESKEKRGNWRVSTTEW